MTSRSIPIALQTHTEGSGTTLCWLLKITLNDQTIIGVTSLDQNVTYDDGVGGPIVYKAPLGLDQSAIEYAANAEVDNSEGMMLLVEAEGVTAEGIDAGLFDYGRFVLYRVNWSNLSQGHIVALTGTTGAVKVHDQIAGIIELRGLPQTLKQTFLEQYSLTCRAIFGGGSYGNLLFPCGFDADSLWQNHSVDVVGAEPNRLLTANAAPAVMGPNGALPFVPGVIEWLTGDNAGHLSEVEVVAGAAIDLRLETPRAIQVGDTFRIRPDCDKTKDSCINLYDNFLNFRGEPYIPVSDELTQRTPGALKYPLFPHGTSGPGVDTEIP